MKRSPIDPSPKFTKQLKAVLASSGQLVVDGIAIDPPTKSKPNWRLKARINRQTKELSGGRTLASVNAAFIELRMELFNSNAGAGNKPEHSANMLAAVIRKYIDQGGIDFIWKDKTRKDREDDFRYLIQRANRMKIRCHELTENDLREFLKEATGSAKRAKHIKGVLKTFMMWGRKSGYFTSNQLTMIESVSWNPPTGSGYRTPPTRREQSRLYFSTYESQGGEIPTHEQVCSLADGLQKRYQYGAALIHASANLGTRANETFIFTASREVFEKGLGNYVDLENWVVRVHWQQSEKPTEKSKTTKNEKRRGVFIPGVEVIATGFDLRAWLTIRSAEALVEQAAGKNPLALLFPNKNFNPIKINSLSSSHLRKVSGDLGWKMVGWTDAKGITRFMYRFSLHAMRDRFGTTAADEWGYSERQLLEQGSWSDPQTVRKYYLGTSDGTAQSVKDLHLAMSKGAHPFKKGA
jgi:hypothetical protein